MIEIKNLFMENMNQLKDLLKHEVEDLYSAEEQIIDALPKMIEKANNEKLKQALQDHLEVTEQQKDRLDQVLESLSEEDEESEGKGIFGLFGKKEKCKAMEGLIKEAESLMEKDMSPEVSDAAIIAASQKIEHYEISSYGTARAYAQELNLGEVEALLKETLDEEYEADDLLTELAESRINEKAKAGSNGKQKAASSRHGGRSGSRSTNSGERSTSKKRSHATVAASSPRGGRSSARSSSKTSSKKSSGSRSGSPASSKGRGNSGRRSSSR
jgi:ferritin-like metal-binding protein YciE